MKILLIHNYYRSSLPSGENAVFMAESALLRGAGHDVFEYTRSNDEAGRFPFTAALEATLLTPWNPASASRVHSIAKKVMPDVVHIHNTFPLITPAAVWTARRAGAAVVCTLHNYRIWCAAAVAMRDGRPCTECLTARSVRPALRYGCYRGSRIATIPVAAGIALHQRLNTWGAAGVDRVIALTESQRQTLVDSGVEPSLVSVKPNFTGAVEVVPWHQRENRLVCIGRLTPEKGVDLLLDALRGVSVDIQVEIIGAGPQSAELARYAQANGLERRVRFLGQLPAAETRARLASAKLLVMASRWFETFGLPIIEAYARGVPVVAPRHGSFPELVSDTTGALFAPGDPGDLRAVLETLWQDDAALRAMSAASLQRFKQNYSPDANLTMLMNIYSQAIDARDRRGSQV